ncbi:oligopeptide/dipeptide ABC transporter ATP-binding protein [Brevibacillus fluminis]|uniref:oligopeptide/dipeptide ABC transporter ATP-binding protein n=1 Tax=Brevibacillus fluminis TaxID=511487 RepID=UPI003F8C0B2C
MNDAVHPDHQQASQPAVPLPNPLQKRERIMLRGEILSPMNPPSGCIFHTRCPFVMDRCKREAPVKQEAAPQHFVSCHLYS